MTDEARSPQGAQGGEPRCKACGGIPLCTKCGYAAESIVHRAEFKCADFHEFQMCHGASVVEESGLREAAEEVLAVYGDSICGGRLRAALAAPAQEKA